METMILQHFSMLISKRKQMRCDHKSRAAENHCCMRNKKANLRLINVST